MPEADIEGNRYFADQVQQTPGFFLKGSHQLDWGMKNRLARVFDPRSGRTVMLAVDHGYFQGPTTGLERIDLSIVPLLPSCDALFCTRGILRSVIPAETGKPIVLRASGGPSILREDLSDEQIAMDMEDAVRLNAAGIGIQVFIGGEFETRSVHNMTKLVDAGVRLGMPVMGVTAVGKNMVRDAKYFRLACRIIAELGAQYVKTYYVEEGFETVTASCPVPIVMAGGKKLPELDALTMAYNAVQQGAAGVDMGRNIFQSEDPKAMITAVDAVVHKNFSLHMRSICFKRSGRKAAVNLHKSERPSRRRLVVCLHPGHVLFQQIQQCPCPGPMPVKVQVARTAMESKSVQAAKVAQPRGGGNCRGPVHQLHAAIAELCGHGGDQLCAALLDQGAVPRRQWYVAHGVQDLHGVDLCALCKILQELRRGRPFRRGLMVQPQCNVRLERRICCGTQGKVIGRCAWLGRTRRRLGCGEAQDLPRFLAAQIEHAEDGRVLIERNE